LAGDVLWGLGAADMKGGLAVMMEVATRLAEPAFEVTYVFYAGEEISRDHNGLLALEVARPDLLTADVAILGEPTGGAVEAGCQGVLKLEVITGGRRAHSARPWMGVNAVHRLGPVLDLVSAAEAREPEIEGCRYREALQAVRVEGGVAANVVPDRASVVLNHRFAPDRSAGQAEAAVRALLAPALEPELGDRVEVLDLAPAAAPALDHAVLSALVRATGRQPRAKLGWTDVAFFAERGIPAANFGPGDSELAHTTDERVSRDELEDAFAVLWGLLSRH
jgi:succinyl-diaminopimelate desuccinylase